MHTIMKSNMINRFIPFLLLIVAFTIGGCEDDKLLEYDFTNQQLAAKQLVGTWSEVSNIETPIGVPTTIFKGITVFFSVDKEGNPRQFRTEGSNTVFVSGQNSTWEWADTQTITNVLLEDVEPISKITVDTSVIDRLTIAFVSDWHDTDGNTGTNAQFKITLKRQKR